MYKDNLEILYIPTYYKWKLFLYPYENEKHCLGHTKFVICPNKKGDLWLVFAVRNSQNSTQYRALLNENWRGLEREELVSKSKIDTLVYINLEGTQGGSIDSDGAIKLAEISYELLKDEFETQTPFTPFSPLTPQVSSSNLVNLGEIQKSSSDAVIVRSSLTPRQEFISNAFVFTEIPEGTDPMKCIATHGQKFHADESLSCSLLKLLPDYKDYSIFLYYIIIYSNYKNS